MQIKVNKKERLVMSTFQLCTRSIAFTICLAFTL